MNGVQVGVELHQTVRLQAIQQPEFCNECHLRRVLVGPKLQLVAFHAVLRDGFRAFSGKTHFLGWHGHSKTRHHLRCELFDADIVQL